MLLLVQMYILYPKGE